MYEGYTDVKFFNKSERSQKEITKIGVLSIQKVNYG